MITIPHRPDGTNMNEVQMRVAPLQPEDSGRIELPETDVDIWSASIALGPEIRAWEGLLTPEERERAGRFRFHEDYQRFVYGRGLLRELLSRYVGSRPTEMRFNFSQQGKPELAPGYATPITFNLSHSGSHILLAFAHDRRIGVDVELMRPDVEVEQIAKRFFSAKEQEVLASLDKSALVPAFFRCWTRKEAYVKAVGTGLSLALDQFDVSLRPGEPADLMATRPDPDEARKWILRNIDIETDYAAAFVVERNPVLQE